MSKIVRFSSLILLLVALFGFGSTVAKADDTPTVTTNTTKVTRYDVGKLELIDLLRSRGYKVFHPGAIKSIGVRPDSDAGFSIQGSSATRRGFTDAWLSWSWSWDWRRFGWEHRGGHESSSDLWEDQIWSDGFLKITIDPGWRTSCANHTAGSYSWCGTSFFQLLPRTIKAQTNHFFQKSGYINSYLTTSDTA